ncbi:unnamed protein product [Clonostachys byssicola]|uniref:Mitochondrial 2-oxoglutarate/malate carrier protein n=1 Tax=Clonostachys byssicola TaxID=160290 RepID=A0A9N9XZL3_9HYPO|nr:unnamed protein product [Clonostachys byssicola]
MASVTVANRSGIAHAREAFSSRNVAAVLPFVNGGASGMVAFAIIQPVDMIKVRMQLVAKCPPTNIKPTSFTLVKDLASRRELLELYSGLSAGLLRQAVYATARLGIFDTFMKVLQERADERHTTVTFFQRAGAGLASGAIAAFLANPADLALVTMQSDGMRPMAQRQNYKSVFDALGSIVRSDGITSLWAGCTPTIARAMALNLGQLALFSDTKARLKEHTSWSIQTQTVTASALACLFASTIALPFDLVKTRLQRRARTAKGALVYRSMTDCFGKIAKEEGLTRFYRGFGIFYLRTGPHAMLTLILADYFGWLTGAKQT